MRPLRAAPAAVLSGAWALVALASLAALRYVPVPFAWMFAVGGVAMLLTWFLARTAVVRVAAFNLALLLLALAGIEAWLAWRHAGSRVRHEESAAYRRPDPLYGIAGVPGADTVVRLHHEDTLVWQARYRLDGHGLRVTPPGGNASQCVVFFGCSFTFGDGVDDEETMPSRVVLRSGGRVAATNLGVGGAGPQQMLARLESGGLDEVLPCSPTAAIYTAIPHHVYRVAGKPPRHNFGPAYGVRPDGSVVRQGRIEDRRTSAGVVPARFLAQLEKSHLFVELTDRPRVDDDDVATFVAVVKAAADRFRRDHPGATFDVLLWDDVPYGKTPFYATTLARLRAAGLPVHPVAEILPGYEADRSRYQLAAQDRHPNARAYDALAAWIAGSLLHVDSVAAGTR